MRKICKNYDIPPPPKDDGENEEFRLVFDINRESLIADGFNPIAIKLEKPNNYNRNKLNWSSWKAIPS